MRRGLTAAVILFFCIFQVSTGDALGISIKRTLRLRHKSKPKTQSQQYLTEKTVRPLHKSEPTTQTHQYLVGDAARVWPGTNDQELISQADWTAFFDGTHHEIWDYIGARTEYSNTSSNPTIEDGTITYGGRYAGGITEAVFWTPPDEFHDVPYSAFDASEFNTTNPVIDPLENDDGSHRSDGNLSVGSWPNVGDDIIEGAHEEDLFFIHKVFGVLYNIYGDPAFNPATDYLQDEFYNGWDYDAAEAFYHHLWRRTAHNDSDIDMMGVSWRNCQSSWEEVNVMPDIFAAHPSPIQIAEGYWKLALDYYLGQNGRTLDKELAYYFLGRIAHLLVDMSVPAHAHCDPHSPVWPDSYEDYMGSVDHYSQYTYNEIPIFDSGGNVTGTTTWSYNIGDWGYKDFDYVRNRIAGTKWDPSEASEQIAKDRWNSQSHLFHLFWCTAEIADNFDSNSADGEVDRGAKRANGLSEYELRLIADKLMPRAMRSVAELYKLFMDTVSALPPPMLDVKANGADGPITVSRDTVVRVTVELDPGERYGQNADWWIIANIPTGWYSYLKGNGWNRGISLYDQAPLTTLAPLEVWLDPPPRGPAEYTVYFGVDDNADGNLDGTWYDSVTINSQ